MVVESGASTSERMAHLDPVRRLIIDRARELRLTLADLNRHVGKNGSYFHQFMWKGRPRKLPEDVRVPIAQLLELPDDALRGNAPVVVSPLSTPLLRPLARLPVPVAAPARDLPVYRDTDLIDPAYATEWIARPVTLLPSGPMFGLWITGVQGRLQPGDLALVSQGQAPRAGDTAVALRGKSIAVIGTLTQLAGQNAIIEQGDSKTEIDLTAARILKVVCVVLG